MKSVKFWQFSLCVCAHVYWPKFRRSLRDDSGSNSSSSSPLFLFLQLDLFTCVLLCARIHTGGVLCVGAGWVITGALRLSWTGALSAIRAKSYTHTHPQQFEVNLRVGVPSKQPPHRHISLISGIPNQMWSWRMQKKTSFVGLVAPLKRIQFTLNREPIEIGSHNRKEGGIFKRR